MINNSIDVAFINSNEKEELRQAVKVNAKEFGF